MSTVAVVGLYFSQLGLIVKDMLDYTCMYLFLQQIQMLMKKIPVLLCEKQSSFSSISHPVGFISHGVGGGELYRLQNSFRFPFELSFQTSLGPYDFDFHLYGERSLSF